MRTIRTFNFIFSNAHLKTHFQITFTNLINAYVFALYLTLRWKEMIL